MRPYLDRKPTPLPPTEVLKSLLDYAPESGQLIWKARDESKRWNARYAGKNAFTASRSGYLAGSIASKSYQAHRVIWKIWHGTDPTGQIDHINGIRSDNRIENLRDVTPQQNSRNRFPGKLTQSGHVGVCWKERQKKWVAYIFDKGKQIPLGAHKSKEEAIGARLQGELTYGYRI